MVECLRNEKQRVTCYSEIGHGEKMLEPEGICYCTKERNFNTVELQCGSCFNWFHEKCVSVMTGKCVPFMTNYSFCCKMCSPTGIESFTKKQANFSQMCQTALANLMQESVRRFKNKTYFSKDKDIIPYIDTHWEYLTTMPRRIKLTWHTTVMKTMLKESEVFTTEEPSEDPAYDVPNFGLVMNDLHRIGPNYENFLKQVKVGGGESSSSSTSLPPVHNPPAGISGKGRSVKRKMPEQMTATTTTKKQRSDLTVPKLPAHGYPMEHPFNKDGYRYLLAEPDLHAPHRREFDESADWAGKPIPGWLYRTNVPPTVLLALNDRAPQLLISEDRLAVIGDKGYSMVRATHGINRGSWYFEAKIEEMPEGSATRLGWSQALGNLQAPLGYDRFSYAWRSRKGTRFHESRGKHYSSGYEEGDTLGFYIDLPRTNNLALPQTFKDKPLVKFKSHLYYEEKDDVQKAIKQLQVDGAARMVFYKNGQCQRVAWEGINRGTYYPAISVYKKAAVSINFGPRFKYPPRDVAFRGMHEAAHEATIEQTLADILYLVENEGKLRLDILT
uniref:B30.2/SPRY domain-containing protein n=1 Tax=Strigamia maritima TaxID=126957 RepID=T1INU9_STRMM